MTGKERILATVKGEKPDHRAFMPISMSLAADEIAAIEDLMSDLEKRLRRLSGSAKREASGASGDVGDFVSEALARIMARVRDSASDTTESVADDMAGYGIDAIKKLTREVEQRPPNVVPVVWDQPGKEIEKMRQAVEEVPRIVFVGEPDGAAERDEQQHEAGYVPVPRTGSVFHQFA